jgi:uncharacterized damage-inducible protein DinB
MSWTGLLTREIEYTYGVTEKLIDKVSDGDLTWKPPTGTNWMTTGQLLMHIATACGPVFQGFITGDWGLPEGADPSQLSPDEMLPPAEKMPSIDSVAKAKALLAEDKRMSLDMLGKTSEDDLAGKKAPAPWDPSEMILGHRLLQMLGHLTQHKGQLFYYLKLQGKPVNTGDLWGM